MEHQGRDEAFIEHVRRMYEHSPDAVLCVGPDKRVLYANDAVARLHGRPVAELVGRRCEGPAICSERPCTGCLVDEVLLTGEQRSCNKHEVTSGGVERFIEQSWFPVTGPDGRIVYIMKSVRDVTSLRQAERALDVTRGDRLSTEGNRAQTYLDVAAAIMIGVDPDGIVTLVNQRGCEALGLDEAQIVGRSWFESFVPDPDERARLLEHHAALLAGARITDGGCCASTIVRSDGENRIIEWHSAPLIDADGTVTGVLSSGIDMTERRATEIELQFKSLVLDKAIDSIIVHTPDGRILYANQQACRITGYTREEFLALDPFAWVAPGSEKVLERAREQLEQKRVTIYECGAVTATGEVVPVEVHAMIVDIDGQQAVISAARDVTERKQAEDTIARMAFYDALTGLANRALFFDRLQHAIAGSRRTGEAVAVAFLDLDNFKGVNDTLGHRTGDALLIDIANRLVGCVRTRDTVARLGGDEFTVLFDGIADESEATDLAERLLGCFRAPFDLGDEQFFITASVGLAVSEPGGSEADDLLLHADTAMYYAKEQGRNGAQVFRPHMGESARERFALKNDLRHALERGELSIDYQPIFRVFDGGLVGVEALLRWEHPERGPVSPSTFLPLAEESGEIVPIGSWVLHEACEQTRAWRAAGLPPLRLSVNLSARQLEDPDLRETVASLLDRTGMQPGDLELEVSEAAACDNILHMRATFDELREMGVKVAIDDFGTGVSSFESVMHLNVDALKLDRRFVGEVGRGGRARAVCGAIIFLAHSLGLNVVAEGVENDEQLLFLLENDCDEMQGFLMGRPLPAADFAASVLQRGGGDVPHVPPASALR